MASIAWWRAIGVVVQNPQQEDKMHNFLVESERIAFCTSALPPPNKLAVRDPARLAIASPADCWAISLRSLEPEGFWARYLSMASCTSEVEDRTVTGKSDA